MAQIKQAVGTRTALTVTGIGTLAGTTYAASGAYVCNTNQPLDVIVEVNATTTNTPAGGKAVSVFIQESLDGTNFRSGPTSGTNTADEGNLKFIGSVQMATASVAQMGTFSIAQSLGYVPYAFKVIIKNEMSVALTAGSVFTSEVTATSV